MGLGKDGAVGTVDDTGHVSVYGQGLGQSLEDIPRKGQVFQDGAVVLEFPDGLVLVTA